MQAPNLPVVISHQRLAQQGCLWQIACMLNTTLVHATDHCLYDHVSGKIFSRQVELTFGACCPCASGMHVCIDAVC